MLIKQDVDALSLSINNVLNSYESPSTLIDTIVQQLLRENQCIHEQLFKQQDLFNYNMSIINGLYSYQPVTTTNNYTTDL